jgi:hypothetical protein
MRTFTKGSTFLVLALVIGACGSAGSQLVEFPLDNSPAKDAGDDGNVPCACHLDSGPVVLESGDDDSGSTKDSGTTGSSGSSSSSSSGSASGSTSGAASGSGSGSTSGSGSESGSSSGSSSGSASGSESGSASGSGSESGSASGSSSGSSKDAGTDSSFDGGSGDSGPDSAGTHDAGQDAGQDSGDDCERLHGNDNDRCGTIYGCQVSACAHECNKQHALTCPRYKSCFDACKDKCDVEKAACEHEQRGH